MVSNRTGREWLILNSERTDNMWFFTGKGDGGESNLFNGRRLPKSEEIFDLIGTLDEATASIGLCISLTEEEELKKILIEIQDDLSKLMGRIAGADDKAIGSRFDLVEVLEKTERLTQEFGHHLDNPNAFIYSGKSTLGASLDICRTVIRRAEREAVRALKKSSDKKNILAYINRLSSLLFVLRLTIDQENS